jgi:kynurenine formamidase
VTEQQDLSLWGILETLQQADYVDLTHAFETGIPHAPDFPDEERRTLYDFEPDGFQAHLYTHVGQWGTHADPPIHFARDGRTLDEISVRDMILPLVIFDVSAEVSTDPDFVFGTRHLAQWERVHGPVPPRAFAALCTGWSDRWPDADQMANKDLEGVSHFPGWGVEAVEFLCSQRKITAIGHETTDTDPGVITSEDRFPAETLVLSRDCYQIELLCNLKGLPETGSIIVASFPKPKKGSGFPARAFAIAPGRP